MPSDDQVARILAAARKRGRGRPKAFRTPGDVRRLFWYLHARAQGKGITDRMVDAAKHFGVKYATVSKAYYRNHDKPWFQPEAFQLDHDMQDLKESYGFRRLQEFLAAYPALAEEWVDLFEEDLWRLFDLYLQSPVSSSQEIERGIAQLRARLAALLASDQPPPE